MDNDFNKYLLKFLITIAIILVFAYLMISYFLSFSSQIILVLIGLLTGGISSLIISWLFNLYQNKSKNDNDHNIIRFLFSDIGTTMRTTCELLDRAVTVGFGKNIKISIGDSYNISFWFDELYKNENNVLFQKTVSHIRFVLSLNLNRILNDTQEILVLVENQKEVDHFRMLSEEGIKDLIYTYFDAAKKFQEILPFLDNYVLSMESIRYFSNAYESLKEKMIITYITHTGLDSYKYYRDFFEKLIEKE